MATITVQQNYSGERTGNPGSATNPYTTISEAVAAATAGDTIDVGAGNYAENVILTKAVTLVGAGQGSTIITGDATLAGQGTIEIKGGVNNVSISGFTIIGIDGTTASEKAAIYIQGAHTNIEITNNNVVANGDPALVTEYGSALNGLHITNNTFSGQTFLGNSNQVGLEGNYVNDNAPRPLVFIGTNGDSSNSSDVVFSGNVITGTAGGLAGGSTPSGNTLVNIDVQGAVISGNTFTGFTTGSGEQLRSREENPNISNNTFSNADGGKVGMLVLDDGAPGTYSANALTYGGGNDNIVAGLGATSIDGGAGIDTISMTNAGAGGAVVVLDANIASSTGTGNIQITNIENVRGSAATDSLTGNSGDNTFFATTGNDIINGRDGTDTYDASSASVGLSINLQAGTVSGGSYGGTLANIENVTGGSGNDTITGSTGVANTLSGGAGNDSFSGLDNGDVVNGGTGSDSVSLIQFSRADAEISSGPNGTIIVTVNGHTITLSSVGELNFSDGRVLLVDDNGGSDYTSIQAAINDAGEGDEVFVLNGTYAEQISVTGKTDLSIVGESEAGVILKAASGTITNNGTDPLTGKALHAIVVVSDSTGVTISGLTVDGDSRANQLANNNGDFVGIAFLNSSGGVKDVTVIEIRDPLSSNGDVSGNQRGTGIYSSNGLGNTQTLFVQDSTVEGFQKTGIRLINTDVSIVNNDIDGGGPHQIIGQNGITLLNGSHGEITGNDISGIGFTPGTVTVGGVLVYNSTDGLNIEGNTFNGTGDSDTFVYISNSSDVTATGNTIKDAHTGVIDVSAVPNDTTDNTYTRVETNYSFESGNSGVTVSGTAGHDELYGGDGDDTFTGLGGDDTIDGGAGKDTAVFEGNITAADVVYTNGSWQVKDGTATDTLTNVEIVDGAGEGRILLVGNGGFTSIQAAIDAAADGDTIVIGAGTWTGNLNLTNNGKDLTFVGVNSGLAGTDDDRGSESVIKGTITISGSGNVTFDGVRVEESVKNWGVLVSIGNGGGDVTFVNSVIYNSAINDTTSGGQSQSYGIHIQTGATGQITIEDSLFTGASTGQYRDASWAQTIWGEGNPLLIVSGNSFIGVRNGINMIDYTDAGHLISGNHFINSGTAITIGGSPIGGYLNIENNTHSNVVSEFNFRNIASNITIDLSADKQFTVTDGDIIEILGGRGADRITGTSGNDRISGDGYLSHENLFDKANDNGDNGDDDIINAGAGDDTVFGEQGNDTIDGGDGDDMLYGNSGNDTLVGGKGDDTLDGGKGDDTLIGGAGDDLINGGDGTDTVVFAENFSDLTIVKFAGGYLVDNGTSVDQISNVEIFQFADGTQVNVVDNPDALKSSAAPSIVSVNEIGTDEDSNPATLRVLENAALNTKVALVTATDANLIVGDQLNFTLVTADGSAYTGPFKITKTAAGTAEITVSGVVDFESLGPIVGLRVKVTDQKGHTAFQNVSVGITNVNEGIGGLGGKTVVAEAGTTKTAMGLDAPAGNLDFEVTALTTSGTVYLGNTVVVVGQHLTAAQYEALTFSSGAQGTGSIKFLVTQAGVEDTQTVDVVLDVRAAESKTYNGTAGADRLDGADGNDVLDGKAGADVMIGGKGNDTFIVDNAGDSVVENSNGGTDTVQSSISYTLGTNVEKLTLTGANAINGTGNAVNNVIVGNDQSNILKGLAGNDTLDGGAGADKLYGGVGKDTLTGGLGKDTFYFSAVGESVAGTGKRDIITDFKQAEGDRISLSAIDANAATSANEAFVFIGKANFSGVAGELRAWKTTVGDAKQTLIAGDVDGDGKTDFHIELTGHVDLVKGDFIL